MSVRPDLPETIPLQLLEQFSANLLEVTYKEKNPFFYMMLYSVLDQTKAARATIYKYEQDIENIYNQQTIIFEDSKLQTANINKKLEQTNISLKNDLRGSLRESIELLHISDVPSRDDLHNPFDNILDQETGSIVLYPIWFNDSLVHIVEICKSTGQPDFSEQDLSLLRILLNFCSAIISNIYLYEWAIRDSLTSCYAVSFFNKMLDELILDNLRQPDMKFSICLLDVDDFKKINDTFGHLAGDQAIVHCTRMIQSVLRQNDILARYGGDEFGIIIKHSSAQKAKPLIKRIVDTLRESHFTFDNQQISFTISCGVAEFTPDMADRDTLVKKADLALYQSKNKGKNCFTIYKGE